MFMVSASSLFFFFCVMWNVTGLMVQQRQSSGRHGEGRHRLRYGLVRGEISCAHMPAQDAAKNRKPPSGKKGSSWPQPRKASSSGSAYSMTMLGRAVRDTVVSAERNSRPQLRAITRELQKYVHRKLSHGTASRVRDTCLHTMYG